MIKVIYNGEEKTLNIKTSLAFAGSSLT